MQSECDLHHKHGVTSFTVRDRELCHYAETVKAMLTIPSSLTAQTSAEVGCEVSASRSKLSLPQKERRRALIVPREHGAWGMLLIPLLTGGAVGHFEGGRVLPVLLLTLAVLGTVLVSREQAYAPNPTTPEAVMADAAGSPNADQMLATLANYEP